MSLACLFAHKNEGTQVRVSGDTAQVICQLICSEMLGRLGSYMRIYVFTDEACYHIQES